MMPLRLTRASSQKAMAPAPEPAGRVRVAVLIPVHNDWSRLARTLTALAFDGGSFDVVVVDDGSTPPLEIPPDLPFRVELLRLERNLGITGALNAGLAHIVRAGHYVYVARLDAGDVSRPGRIAAQVAFLDAHRDHAVVGCATAWVDLDRRLLFEFRPPTTDGELRRFQRYRVGLVHPAVMLRVTALGELGFYDERFSGAEEYELFLRLARRYKLANLPEVYVEVELSPWSLSARRFQHGVVRLRVQAHYFEPHSAHAWLGFARSILLLFATRGLVIKVKGWLAFLSRRNPGQSAGLNQF